MGARPKKVAGVHRVRLQVGDRVRIRATHVHSVKGYQTKSLGYKRLVGRLVRLDTTVAEVDFTQYDMPASSSGWLPGQNVRLNKHSKVRQYTNGEKWFPLSMLEPAP